ncbi:KICSTOR complex protein SZT2-like isoform X3 [Anneissia japonica]|uniref:KICSTOR complex protein SZT2-like isoform X3 n=1 Tax=Anneissia japonica TaxID=1529436 RepID=UPI00142586CF|nr:KICSTOR complex protein SZT2-like isoform X3 [Anneissia japonica]
MIAIVRQKTLIHTLINLNHLLLDEKQIEVRLALPWRHNDRIEYTAKATWPLDSTRPLTQVEIMIEGSYEFLHDLTCQMRPRKPNYRMLVIKKFWEALRSVNETDQLLEHLQSFASNAIFYTVPERTKEGMPLLYMPPGSETPVLSQDLGHSKDSRSRQFADFWKRISLMDPKKWQRWFHTHRIGMVLTHDIPLPKHLHYGNHNGKFNNVQSRLAQSTVNQLLRTWSTFVLLENHSYIKLMYKDDDEKSPPYSFYIIRVLSKPPCMVLRLAFLGGTSGHVRNQIMKNLKSKLVKLESPQRASHSQSISSALMSSVSSNSARSRRVSGSAAAKEQQKQFGNPCVVLISKPTEIILIRYEWIPHDFFNMEASMSVTSSSLPVISSSRPYHHQHHHHHHHHHQQQQPPKSLNRLACYFHHRRWVWAVQRDEDTPQVSEQAMSTVLSILRDIRLKEGFHFAYSNSGIISLIIEFQMKESSAAVLCDDELDIVKSKTVTLTEKLVQHEKLDNNTLKQSKQSDHGKSHGPSSQECAHLIEEKTPELLDDTLHEDTKLKTKGTLGSRRNSDSTHKDSVLAPLSSKCSNSEKDPGDSRNDHENDDELEAEKLDNFPCLLQYVIFPVHHASRDRSFFPGVDENAELDIQPAEEDSILHLVTECWIEPQSGIVQATEHHKYLQGLAYDQVPNAIFPRDSDIISTFLSYESLKAKCSTISEDDTFNQPTSVKSGHHTKNSSNLDDGPIHFVPFDVDLMKLVSKSQQAEMHFPTFIEVGERKPESSAMVKMSTNELYFSELISSFTHEPACHTKLMLSSKESVEFLEHLVNRQFFKMSGDSPGDEFHCSGLSNVANKLFTDSPQAVPNMVCFLYSLEARLILTIMPASYEDLTKFIHLQKVLSKEPSTKTKLSAMEVNPLVMESEIQETEETNTSKNAKPVENDSGPGYEDDDVFDPPVSESLPLPVYVYNCYRPDLVNQLLGERRNSNLKDTVEDLTFNSQESCTVCDIRERNSSGSSGKSQPEFDSYRKKLTDFAYRSFVISVFRSLRMQQHVHKHDVQAAVDTFCEESLHQVDLTDFVKAACGHVMEFNRQINFEQGELEKLPTVIRFADPILKSKKRTSVTDGLLFSTQSIDQVSQEIDRAIEYNRKRASYSFPVANLTSRHTCEISPGIHDTIKSKFRKILGNQFKPVPSSPDFWYFCTPIMDEDSECEYSCNSDTEDVVMNEDVCEMSVNIGADMASSSGSPNMLNHDETSSISEDNTPSDHRYNSIMDTYKILKQSLTSSELSIDRPDRYGSSNESVNGSVIEGSSPLFIHLTCSVKVRSYRGDLQIQNIPTCLGEVIECLEDEVDCIDLSDLSINLDINCLTLPPLIEWDEGIMQDRRRYTSLCESTPPSSPPPVDLLDVSNHSFTTSEADFGVMSSGDPLLCLPELEQAAIRETEEQIKWLLQNEIASARRSTYPVALNTLDMISKHIKDSTGKPGCIAKNVPLQFVFGPEHSLKKFTQEFEIIELRTYQLTKVKDYYYLIWNNEEIEKKRKMAEEKQAKLKMKMKIENALYTLGREEPERVRNDEIPGEEVGNEDTPVAIIFTPPSPKKLPKSMKESLKIESGSESDLDEVTPRIETELSGCTRLNFETQHKRHGSDDAAIQLGSLMEKETITKPGQRDVQAAFPVQDLSEDQPRNAEDNISRSSGSSIQVLPEEYELERTSSLEGDCSVLEDLVTSLEEAKIEGEIVRESAIRSRDSSIVVLNEFVDNFISEDVNEEGESTIQGDEEVESDEEEEKVITARQTSRSSTGSTITSGVASNESATDMAASQNDTKTLNENDLLTYSSSEPAGEINISNCAITKGQREEPFGTAESTSLHHLKMDGVSSTSTHNTPLSASGTESPTFAFSNRLKLKNTSLVSAVSSGTPSSQISYTSQEDGSWDEEKGYDADFSGDDEDELGQTLYPNSDLSQLKIPDFWLIAKIDADKVNVYFHTGISQEDDLRYQEQYDVLMNLISCIQKTCRVVNQSLLLSDLNETRLCHTLLVPESDEDIWKTDKRTRSEIEDDFENPGSKKKGYLAASMSSEPGVFACNEVFSINIPIHPRLKSTSTERMSKGLLQVINTLSAFSVNNRKNMFVYKDKSDCVFYLRLSETTVWMSGGNSPTDNMLRTADDALASRTSSVSSLPAIDVDDSSSQLVSNLNNINSVTLKTDLSSGSHGSGNRNQHMVHVAIYGITEASPEIKEELIMVLKNKINIVTLKVITVMLVRNPQCKLTPEDVHFIQPPKASEKRPSLTKARFSSIEEDSEQISIPDTGKKNIEEQDSEELLNDQGEPTDILMFTIPMSSKKHLSSIKYYLQQNLLQFLHMPKYVDQRQKNHSDHFRAYHDEDSSKNVYLYIRPQPSGGLGIACISMSTVMIGADGKSKLMNPLACLKPLPNSYKEPVHVNVFDSLTSTEIYHVQPDTKKPGPTSLIEFSIWERGDVDMPSLTQKLLNSVRHSFCDAVMEYLILTAPMGFTPDMQTRCYNFPTSPPITPTGKLELAYPASKLAVDAALSSSSSPVNIKRSMSVGEVSLFSLPESRFFQRLQKLSTNQQPGIPSREGTPKEFKRSQSVSTEGSAPSDTPPKSKKGNAQRCTTAGESPRSSPRPSPKPSPRPSPSPSPSISPSKQFKDESGHVPIWRQQEIESRQYQALCNLYHEVEEGITGCLHPVFKETAIDWLEFEHSLGVPAVHRQKLNLSSRFAVQTVLHEFLQFLYTNNGDSVYKLYKKKGEEFNLLNTEKVNGSSKTKDGKPLESGMECEENQLPCHVDDYMLIGRNIKQWRSSMLYNTEEALSMPSLINSRTHKSVQKFDPLITSSFKPKELCLNIPKDSSYQKQIEAYSIPRQRLLLMQVKDTELTLYTYNWSVENVNQLEKTLFRLIRWHNSRSSLLNSIIYQKMGLFHLKKMVQPSNGQRNLFPHSTPAEIDELVRNSTPPRRDPDTRQYNLHGVNRASLPGLPSLNEVFRNARVRKAMQYCTYGTKKDPLVQHGSQLQDVYHIAKKEAEKQFKLQRLYLEWQKRLPQPISNEMLGLLKKNSRLIHYCCTPLLFSPVWRQLVMNSESQVMAQTQPKSEEPWHIELRSSYVTQYITYLQRCLGFFQIQTIDASPRKSGQRFASRRSSNFYSVAFLRKVVPGGIILLQLAFEDAYFCVMLYAFESSRLPAGQEVNSQLSMLFTDEVNKLKDTIHLHSFTYDFHLRKIQSCISPASRIIFKSDYHVTSFLDDFIKYFEVLPNFSRNEIFKGTEEFKSESTAASLYHYIVDQCNSHHMSRLRMLKVGSKEGNDEHEFAIFSFYQRKLPRSSMDMTSDEYDVSLIVDREREEQIKTGVSKTLRLKYYVIVTNNKELFPKLSVSSSLGRLHFRDKLPKETSQSYHQVRKEASVAKDKIMKMVKQGAYNSRRDFLWKLLPSGEKMEEETTVRKKRRETVEDESRKGRRRDTVEEDAKMQEKTLSYAELKELLGMVHHNPLIGIDSQLSKILDMPVSWFEVLMKALQCKFAKSCSLFASDDRNQLHLVILNPNNLDMLVHISIDKVAKKSELSSVVREPTHEQMPYKQPQQEQVSVYSTQHIENIVSFICYHLWSCIL